MPAPPTLPTDDELVGLSSQLRLAVARLARLLRQQDDGSLGATATAALATVRREGDPTLGELAAQEHVAAPTMTKVVAKLEAGGLVRRVVDPADRRVCRVTITAAGERHLDDSRSRRTAWLVDHLRDLPGEDLARLQAAAPVLERLANPAPLGDR
jgi:DNA-binding MarR family transcriptional regulator